MLAGDEQDAGGRGASAPNDRAFTAVIRPPAALKRVVRPLFPAVLLAGAVWPGVRLRRRAGALAGLLGLWSVVYARYRREGKTQTELEWNQLRTAHEVAFALHYNLRVPTIEEEFDLWGDYHRHRHEMRYDLVAAEARRHLRPGAVILDVGCGSVLVADRLADVPAFYIGLDYGGHHIKYAASKLASSSSPLRHALLRGDGETLPLADASVDVVVFSEVIEHLMRPERAVWELARVLRPGGMVVLTTNNASEVPLRSPLSHLFAWLEKMAAADRPGLMSLRPWVWPEPVDRSLLGLPDEAPDVYLPHTHHIPAETQELFDAAGLSPVSWSTFEFPPPQSATAAWLERHGPAGRRAVDRIEALCRATPGLRRMGTHLFMVFRRSGDPLPPGPPPGIWSGPFSA